MSQLLQRLRDVDPNDSEAVKEIVNTFFQKENLSKQSDVNGHILLRALETLITRFPRYCSQHRNAIEHYLSNFLDSANYYNVIEAAKCAHGLQQIRPSQDKMATPKNCWREQMSILCTAAHTLIEAIFSKTVNIYKTNKSVKQTDIQLLSKTPLTTALSNILNTKKSTANGLDKKTILCNKLRNIFVFIQAMLVEVYPVGKPIQPQLILEVIVQALSVSSSVNTQVSEAATVKIEALRTLDALVCCLGPNLVPFSALVFRFVMQTLRWSSDNSNEESRKVRVAAYNSLSRWLTSLHVHKISSDSKGRSWEDELTKHVIDDITPPKRVVQLTMSNQHTKNLSKKARRKLANTMLQQSTIANHMPGEKNKTNVAVEINDDVAIAALECAEIFLTVCGIFLKPATHKIFHERLVRECYNLEPYSPERSIRLLRTLDSARKNTPPSVPPPTQYCVQLYSTLVNSRCDEITRFCSRALLDIRLQLHCSPPSLAFAIEPQQENKKTGDKRKKLSKKNREMLELLLGKDRVPSETAEEDVITIPDGPVSKKPRLEQLEDEADKISLSSDSEGSPQEISDDSDEDNEEIQLVEESIVVQEQINTETEGIQDNDTEQAEPVILTNGETNEETELDENNLIIVDVSGTNSIENRPEEQTIRSEKSIEEISSIYEAKTQIPILNASNDTVEGDYSPVSMEVTYDYPNTVKEVPVLDKMDDENLPSTNDTDDVQITCGQTIINSQDDPINDKIDNEIVIEPTVNGIESDEKIVENGVADADVTDNPILNGQSEVEVKITTKEISVEDMLADFVDEVVEEGKTAA